MSSWFDIKGTFQDYFRIGGKAKTRLDCTSPTVSRDFKFPDASVDLSGGTIGQVLAKLTSTTIGWASAGGGGGGFTEIANAGAMTGSYDGNVYCAGDVSLSANVVIKGILYVEGNLTNPLGFDLDVKGNCIIKGMMDFTRSTASQSGALNIDGDCFVGNETITTNILNVPIFSVTDNIQYDPTIVGKYGYTFRVVSPNATFSNYLRKSIVDNTLMTTGYSEVFSYLDASGSATDAENFEITISISFPTLQSRGIKAGDLVQFTSGALNGQAGTIVSMSGNVATFGLATFTEAPAYGDSITITPQYGLVDIYISSPAIIPPLTYEGVQVDFVSNEITSIVSREKLSSVKNLSFNGSLYAYKLDVSADQSIVGVKGKTVSVKGDLRILSEYSDSLGIPFYDYILLHGSRACPQNEFSVEGSIYNGTIIAGGSITDIADPNVSHGVDIKIGGSFYGSIENAFSLPSGQITTCANYSDIENNPSSHGGGNVYIGGNVISSGINTSGGSSGVTTAVTNAKATNGGNIFIGGDCNIIQNIFGLLQGQAEFLTAFNVDISYGFNCNPLFSSSGGDSASLSTTSIASRAGDFFCGGNVNTKNVQSTSAVTLFMVSGKGDSTAIKLTEVLIGGSCSLALNYTSASGNPNLNYAAQHISSVGTNAVVTIYGPVQRTSSITIRAGNGGLDQNGGNILGKTIKLHSRCDGNISLICGNGVGAGNGGYMGSFPYDSLSYVNQISMTSGNGVNGGALIASFPVGANYGFVSVTTGNGTTGSAGELLGFDLNGDISGSLSIQLGTTQSSTAGLSVTTAVLSGNVSGPITLRSMRATAAGGNAAAGFDLTINGNVTLRDNQNISLLGGNATTGAAARPPKLTINGNLFQSYTSSLTGVTITGGTVTTGNASAGNIAADTLRIFGDCVLSRLLVTGGNQTTAGSAPSGSAGSILDQFVQINGQAKINVVSCTGGSLASTTAGVGLTGGNCGKLYAQKGLIASNVTMNGGNCATGTRTVGSAGTLHLGGGQTSITNFFTANDGGGGGVATTTTVFNTFAGNVMIAAWTLPSRTTYTCRSMSANPAMFILSSFTGKTKLADNAGTETVANLSTNNMYFSNSTGWRSVTNAAFV